MSMAVANPRNHEQDEGRDDPPGADGGGPPHRRVGPGSDQDRRLAEDEEPRYPRVGRHPHRGLGAAGVPPQPEDGEPGEQEEDAVDEDHAGEEAVDATLARPEEEDEGEVSRGRLVLTMVASGEGSFRIHSLLFAYGR